MQPLPPPLHFGRRVKASQPQFGENPWKNLQSFIEEDPCNQQIVLDTIEGLTQAALKDGKLALKNNNPDKDHDNLRMDLVKELPGLVALQLIVEKQKT